MKREQSSSFFKAQISHAPTAIGMVAPGLTLFAALVDCVGGIASPLNTPCDGSKI
jgi:hypothetical protein